MIDITTGAKVWLARHHLYFWVKAATTIGPVVLLHIQLHRWWLTGALSALVLARIVLWWSHETAMAKLCLFSDELRMLNRLEPRAFEREMLLLLRNDYELQQMNRGSGRGADLVGNTSDGEPVVVLCVQRKPNRKLTVAEVDTFARSMAVHGVRRGVIVTTWRLHTDASLLAAAQGITVIDGPLVDQLRTTTVNYS